MLAASATVVAVVGRQHPPLATSSSSTPASSAPFLKDLGLTSALDGPDYLRAVDGRLSAISGFRENIFMFSYPVMENRILFSTWCILHPVLTVLSTVHPSPHVLTFFLASLIFFLTRPARHNYNPCQ